MTVAVVLAAGSFADLLLHNRTTEKETEKEIDRERDGEVIGLCWCLVNCVPLGTDPNQFN